MSESFEGFIYLKANHHQRKALFFVSLLRFLLRREPMLK